MGDTPAAGQKRPRPGGAEGDDDDDDSRVKKRLQKFAKIGRDQRCGVCRECLNPKSKKACLTVRAQQEREARQQETAERVARELHRLRQGEAALERVLSEALDAEGRFSEARRCPSSGPSPPPTGSTRLCAGCGTPATLTTPASPRRSCGSSGSCR